MKMENDYAIVSPQPLLTSLYPVNLLSKMGPVSILLQIPTGAQVLRMSPHASTHLLL